MRRAPQRFVTVRVAVAFGAKAHAVATDAQTSAPAAFSTSPALPSTRPEPFAAPHPLALLAPASIDRACIAGRRSELWKRAMSLRRKWKRRVCQDRFLAASYRWVVKPLFGPP